MRQRRTAMQKNSLITKCDIEYTAETPFRYQPICGGFEIHNGKKDYTRPIYPPHMNDDLLGIKGKKSPRFIYYLGDRPKLVLQSVVKNVYKRYAHMFMGIEGGKWLDEMENITARYLYGHEEYEITDPSFEGIIRLIYTRSDKLDAMLIKAELPDGIKNKLVIAAAGGNGAASSQPAGGNTAGLEFSAADTGACNVKIYHNTFSIRGRMIFQYAAPQAFLWSILLRMPPYMGKALMHC